MAPTNRLIEARRVELRAEDNAQKSQDAKTTAVRTGAKRQTAAPKPRSKAKA
jgi:hypothetical protein